MGHLPALFVRPLTASNHRDPPFSVNVCHPRFGLQESVFLHGCVIFGLYDHGSLFES